MCWSMAYRWWMAGNWWQAYGRAERSEDDEPGCEEQSAKVVVGTSLRATLPTSWIHFETPLHVATQRAVRESCRLYLVWLERRSTLTKAHFR